MKASKLLTVLLMSVIGVAYAADNSIYIDQVGDNATVTILQDGAGNRVRAIQGVGTGNTTPAVIKGDGISVDVQQIGSGNVLNLGINTAIANGASATSVYYKVTGNNATGTINLNNAGVSNGNSSTTLSIDQTGNGAIADIDILGANNSLTVIQAGGANNKITAAINAANTTSTVNQTLGGGNETTFNLTGDKGTVDVVTVGATNIIGVTQSGGGTNGHYAKVDLNGSGNNVTISQTSVAVDSITNIRSVGSGNTFSVIQRN
jgi:hypothetical protein